MLLSHTQFIENRVYDEDEEEQVSSLDKTRAQNDAKTTSCECGTIKNHMLKSLPRQFQLLYDFLCYFDVPNITFKRFKLRLIIRL